MSLIVKPWSPVIRITPRAIPLFALVTALSVGCNTRSPRAEAASPAPQHEPSSGSERGLPALHAYADRLDEPERDEWQRPEEVVELLDCRPGMTAVDLGAGTGYFLRYLSASVGDEGRVLALDIRPDTIELLLARAEAESLQNVRAAVAAPDDPGLAPRSIDRILIANTWHHISGRVDYAKKLLSSLRPGGLVLIVDFTMDSPTGPPSDRRLTRDAVVAELEAAGFVAEILVESLPYHYLVAGRVP
jgi:predicted methyltransferase